MATKGFTIKMNCPCKACLKEIRKINGVDSIIRDAEDDRKVKITGAVDPQVVIRELARNKKYAELLSEENPTTRKQEMQIEQETKPDPEIHGYKMTVHPQDSDGFTLKDPKELTLDKNHNHDLKHRDLESYDEKLKCEHEHEHELILKGYKKRFSCNGCKEDGFGTRYKCDYCDYELHKECKSPKPTICHELLEGSTFEFSHQPHKSCGTKNCKCHATHCNACGKIIYGYFYHDGSKGLNLHPRCSNLQVKICDNSTTFELRTKVSSPCWWCGNKEPSGGKTSIPGWSYVSNCGEIHFHVHCITQIMHEEWKKGRVDFNADDPSMAMENFDFQRMVIPPKIMKRWGRSRVVKTILVFLRAVVAILLGDPTVLLASMAVELFK